MDTVSRPRRGLPSEDVRIFAGDVKIRGIIRTYEAARAQQRGVQGRGWNWGTPESAGESGADGVGGGLGAIAGADLGEDVADVADHGGQADHEFVRDGLVRLRCRQAPQDLDLPLSRIIPPQVWGQYDNGEA